MRTGIVVLLACAATVACVSWRVHASSNQHVNHFGVVHDSSGSYTEGSESTVGAAAQIFQGSAVSTNSTLTVLALGDSVTANEPLRLGTYLIPTSTKVIEGSSVTLRREADVLK